MVNRPFDGKHFAEPAISGIDLSKLILKRAIYDRSRKSLVVSTLAKPGAAPNTTLKLISLDPAKSYMLKMDQAQLKDIVKQSEYILPLDAGERTI